MVLIEAYKRIVFQELPDAFCIHLLRFSNQGKKMKTFVEYLEPLKVEQVMEPETDDVEVISEEQYHLVAVISHQGNIQVAIIQYF